MTVPRPLFDLAATLARLGVGGVFLAHGWQKLTEIRLSATADGFQKLGVAGPQLSAYYATFVELAAGAAFILGAVVPIAGLLLFLDMLGAFLFVHAGNGVFVTKGGFELVVVLGVASLLLAATGGGRFSLDAMLARRNYAPVRRRTAGTRA